MATAGSFGVATVWAGAGDALFEAVDGLLIAESMPSLPHLSLLPVPRRGWSSWYAALADDRDSWTAPVDARRMPCVVSGSSGCRWRVAPDLRIICYWGSAQ